MLFLQIRLSKTARAPSVARGVAAAAMVVAAGSCTGTSQDSPSYRCPSCNVVVISVDTLRADHVGAYGYGRPTTPNIDALAARGVLFENAISQSSWTRPAHMSILTGMHPREHGYVALADRRRLDDGVATIASVLRENGYTTAAFTGGVNMSADYGFDQGFDLYRTNGKYFRDNFEDARYWLDQNDGERFFLLFHGYDPHTPYLNDPVDRVALGLPRGPPEQGHRKTCRADGPRSRIDPFIDEYDAAVHRADRYVGKLIAELEQRGLAQKTLIVVLSDHGEEFLEHGRCFHLATLYREVLHVPLILVAPGLAPRRVAPLVAASVTIAPTIMEMLGIEHRFPGPSLLAAALGGPVPQGPVVSETERSLKQDGDGLVRSLTTETDKLIYWVTHNRHALFDPRTDPFEQRAVPASSREQMLADQLERWSVAHPRRLSPRRSSGEGEKAGEADTTQKDQEDELRRREQDLRSFGYVE
ncbi:MAG TPA: sulfatase [Candidatus Limnocylindrales bacterium]|nr:sulfatase [Candidatus Limnocylindrales bacterium]